MSRPKNEDAYFCVLRLLQDKPDLSQREIAEELGVSLGATNYLLKALVEKGHVKIENFRASDNKLRYTYILTSNGIETKVRLTAGFLKRKYAEYEALKAEIDALELEISSEQGKSNARGSVE